VQGFFAPLSGAMTFETQERVHEFPMLRIKPREQKGIDQHDHAKQFETRFERP